MQTAQSLRSPMAAHRSTYPRPAGTKHALFKRTHTLAVSSAPCGTSGISSSWKDASNLVNPLHTTQRQESHIAEAAAGAMPMPAATPDAGGFSKFIARIRAIAFFLWSFTLSLPLFLTMMVMTPAVMALDKTRRLAQHFVNNIWAKVSTIPFYPIEIVGAENLPRPDEAAVYVANHQSFMDIYSLFHLNRSFKFISKTSNFLIPIVGWSMFLTGHVMLNRVDRRSQLECLKTCIELLHAGACVLFFPEGTRSKDQVMAGFKKGAFSVACKAGAPVVPVTLVGTGAVMPSGREGEMYSVPVRIVVHPRIQTKGRKPEEVCREARQVIAAALPPHQQGSDEVLND